MKQAKWILALFGVYAALFLSGCATFTETADTETETTQTVAPDNHLRMVERKELTTMDPALATDAVSFNALNNVMEGLYRQGPDNQMILGIAADQPVVSNDGKKMTFQLREEAVWSNGVPVTAEDFVFAWRRAVDPATEAPYRHLFSGIIKNASAVVSGETEPEQLGVYANGPKTLVVELERSYPDLDKLLSLPIFYPLNQEYVEETGTAFGTSSAHVLANGPFQLTGWDETGIRWQYEKNDQYWDAEQVALEKATVEVVKGSAHALERYNNDEVDWIPATGEIINRFNVLEEIREYPTSSIVYLKFNLKRNGQATPLTNEHIRKALALAIDKDNLTTQLLNEAEPAEGIVPAGVAVNPTTQNDFREENGAFLTKNQELAQKHFSKGIDELNRQTISLELIGDDTESAVETLKYLQKTWMDTFPQLEISIQSMPFSQRLKRDAAESFDIQLSGWAADYSDPINFLDIWESMSPQNHSNFSNEEYDHLLQSAEKTLDEETKWELLLDAERLLMEKVPVVPLYQPYTTFLSKTNVRGVVIHPSGPSLSLKWARINQQ